MGTVWKNPREDKNADYQQRKKTFRWHPSIDAADVCIKYIQLYKVGKWIGIIYFILFSSSIPRRHIEIGIDHGGVNPRVVPASILEHSGIKITKIRTRITILLFSFLETV